MADYVRFEIYVPRVYTTSEVDSEGNEVRMIHALKQKTVRQFINATVRKYGGITQANPIAAPLYKGFWREELKKPLTIDNLTYLFGLIRVDQFDEAANHFTTWKQRLEKDTNQQVVLVVYYPVQTIGDFF